MDAVKAYEDVKSHADSIKNDEAHHIESIDVNDAWAQGDVLIRRIAAVPKKAKPERKPELQLATGTTQGSRHTLDSLDGITLYRIDNPNPCEGPVFESDRRFEVKHPEHGDVSLPAGCYAIEYQQAYAEELRRVAD